MVPCTVWHPGVNGSESKKVEGLHDQKQRGKSHETIWRIFAAAAHGRRCFQQPPLLAGDGKKAGGNRRGKRGPQVVGRLFEHGLGQPLYVPGRECAALRSRRQQTEVRLQPLLDAAKRFFHADRE